MKQLYFSVDDIDFMVGALLEIPARGAKVGPTSRAILADGFYRYKNGDRFFYDVQGQPGSFTSGNTKHFLLKVQGYYYYYFYYYQIISRLQNSYK